MKRTACLHCPLGWLITSRPQNQIYNLIWSPGTSCLKFALNFIGWCNHLHRLSGLRKPLWPAKVWQNCWYSGTCGCWEPHFSQELFCLCHMQLLVKSFQLLLCSWSWQILLHAALPRYWKCLLWCGRRCSSSNGYWTWCTTAV